jgi:O-antigen ligase
MKGPQGASTGEADAPSTLWSAVALWVLVSLAVTSPWAFGGVQPWAVRTITTISVVTAGVALAAQGVRGQVALPGVSLWPMACFVALGTFQLVPLPPALHRILAPGSYAIWHPSNVAAATVLGDVARPISIHPRATLISVTFIGAIVALTIVAAPATYARARLERIVTVSVLGTALVGVYGVVGRALLGPLIYGTFAVPTIAPFGPFVSKNHFAGYTEMAALLAIGLAVGLSDRHGTRVPLAWTASRKGSRVILAGAAALALGGAVIVSLSRGGVLSLAAGLCVFAYLRLTRREGARSRWLVLAVAIALLVAAFAFTLPREAHERLATIARGAQDSSVSYRLGIFAAAARAFGSSPIFGFGFGAFEDAASPFKASFGEMRVEHAENDYVELAVEAGLAGVVAMGLAIVFLGRIVSRLYSREESRLKRAIVAGAAGGLAALGVHSVADFNLHIPSNAILAMLLAALACSVVPPQWVPVRRQTGPLAVGLAAALAVSCWVVPRTQRDEGMREMIRTAGTVDPGARRLRAARAEASLLSSIHDRPASAELWLALAWTRLALGQAGFGELARHARHLDPTSRAVAAASDKLVKLD